MGEFSERGKGIAAELGATNASRADEITEADWESLVAGPQRALEGLLNEASTDPAAHIVHHDHAFRQTRIEMLRKAAITIGHGLGADLAGLAELDDLQPMVNLKLFHLDPPATESPGPTHRSSLQSNYSMAGFAMTTRDRVLASNLATERRFSDTFLQRLGVSSAMMAPIREADGPFAGIAVYRTQQRLFTLDDVHSFKAVVQLLNALADRLRRQRETARSRQVGQSIGEHDAGAHADDETDQSAENGRLSPRKNFRYLQMIAPVVAGRMPSREDFYPVECKDISSGGIAFFADRPPEFDVLVVALGRPPYLSRFMARVVYVQDVKCASGANHLVGCQFTERIFEHF
jgi:hypothetical protein